MNISYPITHRAIMRTKDGPFRCDNCEHWVRNHNACNQKNVIEIASSRNKYNLSINTHGEAHPLYPSDCSDFFEKK